MAEAGWTLNPLVAIGIAVAVMFFGYFFGLFEGRGQGYKNRRKEEAEEKKQTPPVEALPPASPPVPSDEIPVLGVSMAPNGELRLKMDGQQMDTSALDAEHRKRLIEILTQIRPWLEAPKSAPPAPQPQPGASPQGGSSPQEAASQKETSPPQATPSPQTVSSPPSSSGPPPAPAADERPTAPPPDDDDDEEPAPAPQSIVVQIDSILQAQLDGTPLKEKGIRLQESPEGGVIVWVGISKYEAVDDVPDVEIKTAIRAAITEWENKYTPGL